jgi:putative transposase
MRKSRSSEEQIAYALRQVENGTPATALCRKLGISEEAFYRWKRARREGVAKLGRVKHLEEEEWQAQAAGRGPDARQGDAAGRAFQNILRPTGKRVRRLSVEGELA